MHSQKKSWADSSLGPLPGNEHADSEDRHLLEKPERRPDVSLDGTVRDNSPRPRGGIASPRLPDHLDRLTDAPLNRSERGDIVGILFDLTPGDRNELVPFDRTPGCPVELRRDVFLDHDPEHATQPDISHAGDDRQHPHRIKDGDRREGQQHQESRETRRTLRRSQNPARTLESAILSREIVAMIHERVTLVESNTSGSYSPRRA